MMEWTDRHCRAFHRTMSRHARLYTEMVTTGAVIHGDRARILGFDQAEHPVALQIGGSEPEAMAQAARIGADMGYAEININCGCPSDRVQNGAFGACLMREPLRVADCVAAIKAVVHVPVTVKCRIGVDEQEPHEALWHMLNALCAADVDGVIVHARKAWLKGLSPRENRDVPPLDYALVHKAKQDFPALPMAINGGVQTLAACVEQLKHMDGVMVGRSAYHNPEMLLGVDPILCNAPPPVADAFEALSHYEDYIADQLARGVRLADMTRHMLGLFAGRAGARAFRRHLATYGQMRGAGLDVVRDAVAFVARSPATTDVPAAALA
jgi:tRNA-dihydrouridine synthase A